MKIIVLSLLLVFVLVYQPVMAEYETEIVASELVAPWSVAFAPDGTIFITERGGVLKIINGTNTNMIKIPVLGFPLTSEGGLLGLALSPNFKDDNHIFIYMTYHKLLEIKNKVVRFTINDDRLTEEYVIIDDIPGASVHNGGRIKFSPDDKLYITTGDAQNPKSAQDLNSLAGKILRLNSDGTIPSDNPFADSPVYSYGHRNSQGLDWNPLDGTLVITEHGPSGEFGQRAHDEINLVMAGNDYGWPSVFTTQQDAVQPLLNTGSQTWAPSGSTFYDSDNIESLSGKYIVATLYGKHVRVIDINNDTVTSNVPILEEFGRIRDATMGLDGDLYILTNNRDSRGIPQLGDDKLIKITSDTNDLCSEGYVPMYSPSGKTVCVFSSSVIILESRGWES